MQNTCLNVHKIANSQNDYDFQGKYMCTSNQCVVGFNDVMITVRFRFVQQVFSNMVASARDGSPKRNAKIVTSHPLPQMHCDD
jgi:hypothetical protein